MDDHVGQILKDRAGGGAFALAGWGFVAVLAFMAGFASWQYAPRPSPRLPVLTAGGGPDTTASIPSGTPTGGRVIGGGRVTTVMAAEPSATQRDLDSVLFELRELKRTLGRYDQANEALVRRVTGLEEQSAVLMSSIARDRDAMQAAMKAEPPRPDPAKPEPMKAEPPRMEAAKAEPLKDDAGKLPPKPAPKTAEAPPSPPLPPMAPPSPLATKATDAEPPPPRVASAEADLPKPPEPKPDPIVTGAIGQGGVAAGGVGPGAIGSGPGAPKPAGVPTMAITLKPPTPEKPADKAEEKPVGVDLGGFRSLAQLRKTWADIEARRGTVTRSLAPLYQLRETGDTLEVRLVAGPFPTPLDAAKFCAAIKGTAPGCASTGYAGQTGVRVAGAPPTGGLLPGLPMPVPAASP